MCLAVLAQFRRTGIGRSIIAVRDNRASAEAMTIVDRRAPSCSRSRCRAASPRSRAALLRHGAARRNTPECHVRAPTESVTLVAIAVIGGLGSIVGPVLGARG